MRRYVGLALVSLCAAVACSALVGVSGAVASEGCANEARRVEQGSTFLPECRAYELVSPPGASVYATESQDTHGAQASVSGSAVAWFSYYPAPGASLNGAYFLSRRGAGGWSTEDMVPPQSSGTAFLFDCKPSVVFSPSLSRDVLSDGWESPGLAHKQETDCPHNEPALVEEPAGWQSEPEGFQNLFLRDNETGGYSLINRTPDGVAASNAYFEAGSTVSGEEFSHVVFEDLGQLTAEAPVTATGQQRGETVAADLYESAGGVVRLVPYVIEDGEQKAVIGELADGIPLNSTSETELPLPGSESAAGLTRAVSSDGERVVFTAGGKLYVRINAMQAPSAVSGASCTEPAKACTVQLDAAQGGSGAGGGATFLWASADGTRFYFMDEASAGLTSTTQSGSGENLYEYRLPEGAASGTLTDLTPYAKAEVDGVSGLSEDGSVVYFVANGVLPGSGASTPGDCTASGGGSCDLYAMREGHATYVATVEGGSDWGTDGREFYELTARVSPNGRYLVFDAKNGLAYSEIWRYALGEGLVCVSCTPSGVATAATTLVRPGLATIYLGPLYASRVVLNDGDVFFNTTEELVEGVEKGVYNVYEYSGGAPHLISTGQSPEGSFFVDASEGGEGGEGTDVFFATTQSLVRRDTGTGVIKLYDARIGGGFASEDEGVESPSCGGTEACKAPLGSPPAEALAASVASNGAGNLVSSPSPPATVVKPKVKPKAKSCRKGFVKKHGRCVKRKRKAGKTKTAKKSAKGGK